MSLRRRDGCLGRRATLDERDGSGRGVGGAIHHVVVGNNVKRRHHTVAQLVLNGFTRTGQLDAWRRNGAQYRTSVEDATVARDFYAFNTTAGQTHRDIEDWFETQVETPVVEVVRRLREGSQPHEDEAPVLAGLVAASLLRTRAVRSLMAQFDHHLAPIMVMARVASDKGWNLAEATSGQLEELRSITAKVWTEHPRDPEEEARSTLRTMLRKYDEMSIDLTRWHWWTEHTDRAAFIIGDAPVITIDAFRDGGWRGLLPEGSPAYLPLSPTCVLAGAPTPPLRASTIATDETVNALNTTIAKNAYDAIYKHPPMPWPRDLQLASQPPRLSAPTHTIGKSDPRKPPTFPATFPDLNDETIADLLELLEAVNVVE